MATLLVVDDDPNIQAIFQRVFADSDISLTTAGTMAEAVHAFHAVQPDVVIIDILLPDGSGLKAAAAIHGVDARIPLIFITADDTSGTAIEAMKSGAFDYLLKPLDFTHVRDLVNRAVDIRRMMQVPVSLNEEMAPQEQSDALVGRCAAMREVYKAIGRVAPQDVTVLIHGESGTGKELIARAIYQHGPRAKERFLAVNCAAIPETLLESELFGHEKGAFTGADSRRIGKFEQCSRGTLFLDEIGDMSPLVQSKVLRVLQEQRFERVGGNETIQTDVRIVAATNRNLEAMVAEGKYRADLYYRLNGFTINLPPLRQRGDDVIVLLEYFLKRFSRGLGKTVTEISPTALELLTQYDWPGNVRELQSVLRQALLQTTGSVLLPEFLPLEIRRSTTAVAKTKTPVNESTLDRLISSRLSAGSTDLYAEALAFMEERLLTEVLKRTGGNQSQAAHILGITRGSLRNKIKQLNITIGAVVNVGARCPEPALN